MAKIETNVIKPEVSFFENELTNSLLSTEEETKMDQAILAIENYMQQNSGEGKTEVEKDELYKGAQIMWKEYTNILRVVKYNFFLNRTQWKLLLS